MRNKRDEQALEDQLKKQKELTEKREQIEKRREAAHSEFKKHIESHDLFFLADRNQYVKHNKKVGWVYLTSSGLQQLLFITSPQEFTWFNEVMHDLNRIKLTAVNTFELVEQDLLNTMSTSNWLKPIYGEEPHPLFDILFNSISGGVPQARASIEQTLVYKYKRPQDFKIPCVCIAGEGGTGKNEVVEMLFATVFGSQQVAAIGSDEAFGQYNGQMLGKTVVFIDEAITEKTNSETLKRRVGNKTLQVNVKFGLQGTVDNTPWYWLGGNGTNGALLLSGDTTDRRYTVITVERNLMHWIGKHIGVDTPGRGAPLGDSHPCVKWWQEHRYLLEDKQQVAIWLGSLLSKWWNDENPPAPPAAYHGDAYTNLIASQKSPFVETMEYVFNQPNFSHIERPTLYQIYQIISKQDGAVNTVKQAKNFIADTQSWLKTFHPDIKYKTSGIDLGDRKTTANVFTMNRGMLIRNDVEYVFWHEETRTYKLVERYIDNVEQFDLDV